MPTVVSLFTDGENQSTVFKAPSGQSLLELNMTVQGSTVPGRDTGIAEVAIDKMPVAGYDFSGLGEGQVKFTLLDYGFLSDGASHSISLQFVRPVLVQPNPYYSYDTNTVVLGDEVAPEPATFGLLLAGVGCVAAIQYRRRSAVKAKN